LLKVKGYELFYRLDKLYQKLQVQEGNCPEYQSGG